MVSGGDIEVCVRGYGSDLVGVGQLNVGDGDVESVLHGSQERGDGVGGEGAR